MEDRSNKTIICSVLFLDIVEYSKKSVTGQISLKDRFNTYLSEAIHDVPVTDRIILDTGDGAAVNFLGDVESALTAALRLRESLLKEDPAIEPKLLVRIGINLGPVRLVRDINGQPNIVGDGINVAQRVMAFADASQILVSRSYFDAVSRLSAQYTGMFHYQGSRTDKHVREHEIYAIGYPGDQTGKNLIVSDKVKTAPASQIQSPDEEVVIAGSMVKQRLVYVAAGIVLLLAAALALMPSRHVEQPVETMHPPGTASPVLDVVKTEPIPDAVTPDKTAIGKPSAEKPSAEKSSVETAASGKPVHHAETKQKTESAPAKKSVDTTKVVDNHVQRKPVDAEPARVATASDASEPVKDGFISFSCQDDTQVFVDGTLKGKIASGVLTVTVKPGKHKVILTHPGFGIFTEEVLVESGKTGRIKPKACN
jgi:hypothetical protein